jgi:hypothetical protein
VPDRTGHTWPPRHLGRHGAVSRLCGCQQTKVPSGRQDSTSVRTGGVALRGSASQTVTTAPTGSARSERIASGITRMSLLPQAGKHVARCPSRSSRPRTAPRQGVRPLKEPLAGSTGQRCRGRAREVLPPPWGRSLLRGNRRRRSASTGAALAPVLPGLLLGSPAIPPADGPLVGVKAVRVSTMRAALGPGTACQRRTLLRHQLGNSSAESCPSGVGSSSTE